MVPAADPHSVSAELCKEYIYVIAAVPTVEVFGNGGFHIMYAKWALYNYRMKNGIIIKPIA